MHRLETSIRSRRAEETWAYLQPHQERLGISRVTNTALLDCIGFPVYAAIRPGAQKGSLCVSSGKSVTAEEARLGALCEAIELELAQYDEARDHVDHITVEEFENQVEQNTYDFCVLAPYLQRIDPSQKIDVVSGQEYSSGNTHSIPASLVFVPYVEENRFFSQSSNGLAGGNSLNESLLHALFEVIERDVLSFARATAAEMRVTDIDCATCLSLEERIREVGLTLHVTYCPNDFGLPMFIAYLFDPGVVGTVSVSRGQGLHMDRGIALIRAITEAIQSRLTNIHGGRDDIVRRFAVYSARGFHNEYSDSRRLEASITQTLPTIAYDDCPSVPLMPSVDGNMKVVADLIYELGFRSIYYYDLTRPDLSEFSVTKVIVPGLEHYSPEFPRVGKRLLHAMGS